MEILDQLAVLDKAFDLYFDAISETPAVYFQYFHLSFDVEFAVFCPSVDVTYPPQLAGYADSFAHVRSHAPLGEALQSLVYRPAFLTNKVAATGCS
jgi:hypothetical protein